MALTGMAGGEVVVAAGLLIASTLLTVLLAGPILGLLGAHSAVSQLGLLATLALVVALPLIAGCAMRTLDPFGGRERSLIEVIGMASLLVLLWEISSELRLAASDGRVAVALLVFLAGAGVLGWLLARGTPPARSASPPPPRWGSTGSWCSSSAPSPFTCPNEPDGCHAGHLDAVRELIDGRQWIVLG